jgi:uncharacterized membrane protein YdjX (TVP38/TMEM64 family)
MYWVAVGIAVSTAVAVLIFLHRDALWRWAVEAFRLLSDHRAVERWVAQWGWAAPVIFILLQVLQVLLAPFPGEATGLIGGYLFGAGLGFCYSSLGLSIGSWLSFAVGRYLGNHFVRRWIPQVALAHFDGLIRHQGIVAVTAMFLMPGFPKDYLCLFLGVSTLPMRAFLALSTLGRMPGTLLLSVQGAALSQQMYALLAAVLFVCLALLALTYRYREALYRWIERLNHQP